MKSLNIQARKTLDLADAEARRMNHAYIGTEHILLGLFADESGIVVSAFKTLGVDAEQVRLEIEKLVTIGPQAASAAKHPLTPRAKQAIQFADDVAGDVQQDFVGPEHLAVGLVRERDGVAGVALRNLGVNSLVLVEALLKVRMTQMKFVERVVRPVPAGIARKRKMREELLGHLTNIYEEEQSRVADPTAAMCEATKRFGDPAELSRELTSALPQAERRRYYLERWFGWRAPESAARYMLRMACQLFVALTVICGLCMTAAMMLAGWEFYHWKDVRTVVAFLLLVPTSIYVLGILLFKLRDTMFGVFGSRKSWLNVFLLDMLIALVLIGLGFGYVAFAEWSLVKGKEMLVPYGVAGVLCAIGALWVARKSGPTEIRDTIWACLDINGAPLGMPDLPSGGETAIEPA